MKKNVGDVLKETLSNLNWETIPEIAFYEKVCEKETKKNNYDVDCGSMGRELIMVKLLEHFGQHGGISTASTIARMLLL